MITFDRNQRSRCTGLGDHLPPESVITFDRNTQAKLQELKEGLRRQMHWPIPETGKWLGQIVAGYFAYHAVPTNSAAISAFRYHVIILWQRRLRRRSQRTRLVWTQMAKLADEFLPKPRILHPWPSVRFAVSHPR